MKLKIEISIRDTREAQSRINDNRNFAAKFEQTASNTWEAEFEEEDDRDETLEEIEMILGTLEWSVTDEFDRIVKQSETF